MELKQIKDLMLAMEKTGTARLKIKEGGYELMLERSSPIAERAHIVSEVYEPPHENREKQVDRRDLAFSKANTEKLTKGQPMPTQEPESNSQKAQAKKTQLIKSPMVGTFYAAPSPDESPFVKTGDILKPDSVVCIVEAMKVMNEIRAGVTGKIVEVMVDDNHPVEFGTPLFKVEI